MNDLEKLNLLDKLFVITFFIVVIICAFSIVYLTMLHWTLFITAIGINVVLYTFLCRTFLFKLFEIERR